MNDVYKSQFKLLLQVIPFISEKPEFALKEVVQPLTFLFRICQGFQWI